MENINEKRIKPPPFNGFGVRIAHKKNEYKQPRNPYLFLIVSGFKSVICFISFMGVKSDSLFIYREGS